MTTRKSALAEIERLKQENARLWGTLLLARDGLLLAVIESEEFEWPGSHPDYFEDGRARSAEMGDTGEWASCRTVAGDRAVQEAVDVVSATIEHAPAPETRTEAGA